METQVESSIVRFLEELSLEGLKGQRLRRVVAGAAPTQKPMQPIRVLNAGEAAEMQHCSSELQGLGAAEGNGPHAIY